MTSFFFFQVSASTAELKVVASQICVNCPGSMRQILDVYFPGFPAMLIDQLLPNLCSYTA